MEHSKVAKNAPTIPPPNPPISLNLNLNIVSLTTALEILVWKFVNTVEKLSGVEDKDEPIKQDKAIKIIPNKIRLILTI